MIKIEERTKELINDRIFPSHWSIINEDKLLKHPNTKYIIPIGNGDDRFRKMLINALKEAKQTIFLCSFILSDQLIIEELLKAVERNVRVYLLFSTEAQLSKELEQDLSEFNKQALNFHKGMLDKFVGKALARTSDHLHAKFLLIDTNTTQTKGFLSTANFTEDALSRNQELGIVLSDEAINECFRFFRRGFWLESKQELIRKGRWDPIKKEQFRKELNNQLIRTTEKQRTDIKEEIRGLIKQSKGLIIISSYGFSKEHEISQLLQEQSKNREIIILTRPRDRNSSFQEFITNQNVKIYAYKFLHSKFVLIPKEKKGFIMTANFEERGLDSGYELGLKLNESMVKELLSISTEWITKARYNWRKSENLSRITEGKKVILEKRSEKTIEIKKEEMIRLNDSKPNNLHKMREEMENPFRNQSFNKNSNAKKIVISKKIIPPRLPEKAIKISEKEYEKHFGRKMKKFPISIYIYKRRYFGLVNSWKEYEKTIEYKKYPEELILVTSR